jgi:hypothetical protein
MSLDVRHSMMFLNTTVLQRVCILAVGFCVTKTKIYLYPSVLLFLWYRVHALSQEALTLK